MPNPWLIVGALIGAIALSGTAYFKGRADGSGNVRAEWMAAELAAAKASNTENIARMDVSAEVGRSVAAALARMRAETATLIGEIKHHVTTETDARYPLPCGLVRLHDAAALGVDMSTIAACAGQPDDAAAPARASDLAALLVQNYGSCHGTAEQVRGWQRFYQGLRARERAPPG